MNGLYHQNQILGMNNRMVLYLGTQVREHIALIRERWVIHNVPVEDIELVIGHGILEMVGRNAITLSLRKVNHRSHTYYILGYMHAESLTHKAEPGHWGRY